MRQIELLYTVAVAAELTGFSPWWVQTLASEESIPVYSRKPILFRVEEFNAWMTDDNLRRYRERRRGVFIDYSKPRHPSARD